MNQMYLSDIDLMKFEHSICSDLDMFMIECYDDYYCEAEGAKEGIFQKIKRKIKEVFDKLKAVFRGKKVQQMDKNIEMAQKAAQNIPATQKNKKIEVFDGEKALKLIEEDERKAKKDPNHKRLDKEKILDLCKIPVAIGIAASVIAKNKKVLPKIIDKEEELNNEVEQAEKEAGKGNPTKSTESEHKSEEQPSKITKASEDSNTKSSESEKRDAKPDKSEPIVKADDQDKKEKNKAKAQQIHENIQKRENKRKFMSDYKEQHRKNGESSPNDRIKNKTSARGSSDYQYQGREDLTLVDGGYSNSYNKNERFSHINFDVWSKSLNQCVGVYTLIIDQTNQTAKEIIDFSNPNIKREKDYIDKVDFKNSDNSEEGSDISYKSKITGQEIK